MTEKQFKKGDCMYDILSGSVGIYEGYDTPQEKLLTKLERGRFFGELGMIDNVERSCTAVVMEKGTELEVIYAKDIEELFEKNPDEVKEILDNLSFRLIQLTGEYMNACRMIYRVNGARNKGNVGNDVKSDAKNYGNDMLVIRSLKL